jgi:hypothetical protein
MKLKRILLAVIFTAIYITFLVSFLELSSLNIALGILSIITLFIICLLSGKVLVKSTVPALRKFSPFFYSLALIVGIVFVSGFTVMAAQNFISLKRAEKLIDNINQYKNRSGHFPTSLEELTPEFYSSLPKVSSGFIGKDFDYIAEFKIKNISPAKTIADVNNYKLLYKSSFGIEYRYISQSQKWEASGDYDFENIKSTDISDPITSVFISPQFSKEYNK